MENAQLAAAQKQIDDDYDLATHQAETKQGIIDECEEVINAMAKRDHDKWVALANEILGLNLDEWFIEQFVSKTVFGDMLYNFLIYGTYLNYRVLLGTIFELVDWDDLIESKMEKES